MDVLEELLRDKTWGKSGGVEPETERTKQISSGHRWSTWRLQGKAGLQRRRKPAPQAEPTQEKWPGPPGQLGMNNKNSSKRKIGG